MWAGSQWIFRELQSGVGIDEKLSAVSNWQQISVLSLFRYARTFHCEKDCRFLYHAEILAVKEISVWLRCNILIRVGNHIFSDSKSAIRNIFLNSRSALGCRKYLNEMRARPQRKFQGTTKRTWCWWMIKMVFKFLYCGNKLDGIDILNSIYF